MPGPIRIFEPDDSDHKGVDRGNGSLRDSAADRRNGFVPRHIANEPPPNGGDVARRLAFRNLEKLAGTLETAEDVLAMHKQIVDGPQPRDWLPSFSGDAWPDQPAIERWRKANEHYVRVAEQVRMAREGVERAYRETHRSRYWDSVHDQRLEELREHYGSEGPQYEMLVERVAALDTRLRQIEASERDDSEGEYRSLSELHLRYLAQLQKHTESTKSESYAGVQEALARMLTAIEREIRPTSPQIWARIAEVVVAEVGVA